MTAASTNDTLYEAVLEDAIVARPGSPLLRPVEWTAAAFLLAIVGLLLLGVTSRYVFSIPVVWIDEAASICFLWLAMLGAAIAIAIDRAEHLRLTLFLNMMPQRLQGPASTLGLLLVATFLLALLGPAVEYVIEESYLTSAALNIPMSWRVGALPVGIALMLLLVLRDVWRSGSPATIAVSAAAIAACAGILWALSPTLSSLGYANILIFLVFFVAFFLAIGVPIAFCFGLGALAFLTFTSSIPTMVMIGRIDEGMSSLVLVSVPIFVLLGCILDATGMGRSAMFRPTRRWARSGPISVRCSSACSSSRSCRRCRSRISDRSDAPWQTGIAIPPRKGREGQGDTLPPGCCGRQAVEAFAANCHGEISAQSVVSLMNCSSYNATKKLAPHLGSSILMQVRMRLSSGRFQPVVAVPARNEEQRIPLLLDALASQTWCRDEGARLPVVTVLNNCSDRTRDAVLDAAARLPQLAIDLLEVDLPAEQSHVGSARRLAMDRALDLRPPPGGVILTTDADAVPDADWIEANLRAIGQGADLVGGRLRGNAQEEAQLGPGFRARAKAASDYNALCDRLASLIDPLEYDPWPRHGDHTGGSLAIRAEMYHAVGGMPALPRREDLALVTKVRAAGGRLVHSMDVRVEVSARLVGRAPGGMADCLKDWLRAEAEGAPLLVEDPAAVEARLRRRRAIRTLETLMPAERVAAAQALGIDAAGAALSSAALVERFAPDEPDAPATMAVAAATILLSDMIRDLEGTNRAA